MVFTYILRVSMAMLDSLQCNSNELKITYLVILSFSSLSIESVLGFHLWTGAHINMNF